MTHVNIPIAWMARQVPDSAWKVYVALRALGVDLVRQAVTRRSIAKMTGLHTKSVRAGLLWLEDDGRVEITYSHGKNPNLYRIYQ